MARPHPTTPHWSNRLLKRPPAWVVHWPAPSRSESALARPEQFFNKRRQHETHCISEADRKAGRRCGPFTAGTGRPGPRQLPQQTHPLRGAPPARWPDRPDGSPAADRIADPPGRDGDRRQQGRSGRQPGQRRCGQTGPGRRPHAVAGGERADGGEHHPVSQLAVTSAKRSPTLPNIPTMAEAGVPGYEFTGWHGIAVRAGTPPAVVDKLNSTLNAIFMDPEFHKKWEALGTPVVGGTAVQFG